jgi:hypothetical protein
MFERLDVNLLNAPPRIQFTHGQRGTNPGHTFPVHDAFVDADSGAPVRPFSSVVWQLEIPADEWPVEGLVAVVVANAGRDSWTVRVPVAAPESWIVLGRDI